MEITVESTMGTNNRKSANLVNLQGWSKMVVDDNATKKGEQVQL